MTDRAGWAACRVMALRVRWGCQVASRASLALQLLASICRGLLAARRKPKTEANCGLESRVGVEAARGAG